MTSPRVLHVVPALFGARGVVGGAERYVLELAKAMAAVVPTSLLAFGDEPCEERAGQLRIRVLGPAHYVRGQRANPIHPGLVREVAGADVVHCHQPHVVASTVAAGVGRALRKRVCCTDLGGGGWDLSAYVSTDRLYHRHLHVSDYSRRRAGHGAWSRAHVIYGGVDAERYSPPPGDVARNTALYVGRLLPHKGVHDFVAAVGPGMRARVVGPAPDPQYLATLRDLAAGRRISFEHECSDAAVVEAYRSAFAAVLPSVYRSPYGPDTDVPELLGQTLLEAMACAVPVVCTRVASLPEVVVDGVTGLVVPPNDPAALEAALRWLIENPHRAGEMGRAGRARVLERFTWPGVVQVCVRLYVA